MVCGHSRRRALVASVVVTTVAAMAGLLALGVPYSYAVVAALAVPIPLLDPGDADGVGGPLTADEPAPLRAVEAALWIAVTLGVALSVVTLGRAVTDAGPMALAVVGFVAVYLTGLGLHAARPPRRAADPR